MLAPFSFFLALRTSNQVERCMTLLGCKMSSKELVMMEGLDEVKRMTWVNARMSRSGERRQGAGADWAALHPGW